MWKKYEEFVAEVNLSIPDNKLNFDLIKDGVPKATGSITLICMVEGHGEFTKPMARDVLRGHGCQKCAKIIKSKKNSKIKKGKPAHNKGVPASEEQKKKQSVSMIEKYKNPQYVHPRLGATLAIETKDKISLALVGRSRTEETNDKTRVGILKAIEEGRWTPPMQGKVSPNKGKTLPKHTNPLSTATILTQSNNYNCTVLNMEDTSSIRNYNIDLKCNVCDSLFSLTKSRLMPSRNNKDTPCRVCNPSLSGISNQEIEVSEFIRSLQIPISVNQYNILGKMELDIVAYDSKIAIDYGGIYWHSELAGKSKWYHQFKMKLTNDAGYKLITMFENEWVDKQEIVKSRIKSLFGLSEHKLDARKCELIKLTSSQANQFLIENHLQGHGRGSISYGLLFGDEIVSCMKFTQSELSRKNKDIWEINRFANKLGFNIRGGGSRLFKAFLREIQPQTIISYADARWGTGDVYKNMGFECKGLTVPNYWYFKKNTIKLYHRYTLRKQKLIEMGGDKNKTEWELAKEMNYNRIWDCGHYKWVWTNK